MNPLKQMIEACGLTHDGAARLLNVRRTTLRAWVYDKNPIPEGVLRDMENIYGAVMKAVDENNKRG